MREILFKGKKEKDKTWVYGLPIYDEQGKGVIDGIDTGETAFSVIPETIGQFTGLTDKNGKKIFEGDIAKMEEYIGTIVFNKKTCGFEFWFNVIVGAYGEKATWARNLAQISRLEVIGNVYDNPELLEAQ